MSLTIGIIKYFRNIISWKRFLAASILLIVFAGCINNGGSGGDDDDETSATQIRGKIDVNVTSPHIGTISQYETLNVTTVYLLTDDILAPINGYIQKVNVTPGYLVKKGDVLFSMQSKEAAAMNIIKDTSLRIGATIFVKATEAGVVKTIARQMGDYVQEGDELGAIANSSSLVFMLYVPFEMHSYIKENGTYMVILPDGETIKAHITSRIPEMDEAVQMERYVLKTSSPLSLPAGLVANVKIPVNIQRDAVILPKSAILCDETQVQFWVMKLVHDSLAVKVPIDKGAETNDSVQIIKPVFSTNDKILVSGNYGLPDTALVKVVK